MTRIALLLLAAGLLVWTAPRSAAADASEEANKKTVVEFYDTAINRKDFEAASKFFGPRYVQHNPMAPDGSCARSSPSRGARSSACGPRATT